MPALSALLEAHLAVGADQLVASNQLEPILGVFQKLLPRSYLRLTRLIS